MLLKFGHPKKLCACAASVFNVQKLITRPLTVNFLRAFFSGVSPNSQCPPRPRLKFTSVRVELYERVDSIREWPSCTSKDTRSEVGGATSRDLSGRNYEVSWYPGSILTRVIINTINFRNKRLPFFFVCVLQIEKKPSRRSPTKKKTPKNRKKFWRLPDSERSYIPNPSSEFFSI